MRLISRWLHLFWLGGSAQIFEDIFIPRVSPGFPPKERKWRDFRIEVSRGLWRFPKLSRVSFLKPELALLYYEFVLTHKDAYLDGGRNIQNTDLTKSGQNGKKNGGSKVFSGNQVQSK